MELPNSTTHDGGPQPATFTAITRNSNTEYDSRPVATNSKSVMSCPTTVHDDSDVRLISTTYVSADPPSSSGTFHVNVQWQPVNCGSTGAPGTATSAAQHWHYHFILCSTIKLHSLNIAVLTSALPPKCDMKPCLTNSKHQHIHVGAKRSVMGSPKCVSGRGLLGELIRPIASWGARGHPTWRVRPRCSARRLPQH